MGEDSTETPFKVVLIGNTSVGKTSLLTQFHQSNFDIQTLPTIGATYFSKTIKTLKKNINLHIWDTAGQERFKSVVPMYLRDCHAAIIMFSVESEDSVLSLNSWVSLLKDSSNSETLIYIVANKIDLNEKIALESGKLFAEQNNFQFFETSSRQIHSIRPLFQKIAEDLSNIETPNIESYLDYSNVQTKKKNCC